MRDEWFPYIVFPISWEQFHQLPKNPIYKWEYWDGKAHLTARPKPYHCLLDLKPAAVPKSINVFASDAVTIRLLNDQDWDRLTPVFAGAFSNIPPFCGMDKEARIAAARSCLEKTQTGGEGPLVGSACFVAVDDDSEPCAAALVTLGPETDLTSLAQLHWKTPPADAAKRGLGRPHLSWIFVRPMLTRHGVGSALLGYCVNALLELGYRQLASTFWLGNESSTLWHWMNGFQLVSWVSSPRTICKQFRAEAKNSTVS